MDEERHPQPVEQEAEQSIRHPPRPLKILDQQREAAAASRALTGASAHAPARREMPRRVPRPTRGRRRRVFPKCTRVGAEPARGVQAATTTGARAPPDRATRSEPTRGDGGRGHHSTSAANAAADSLDFGMKPVPRRQRSAGRSPPRRAMRSARPPVRPRRPAPWPPRTRRGRGAARRAARRRALEGNRRERSGGVGCFARRCRSRALQDLSCDPRNGSWLSTISMRFATSRSLHTVSRVAVQGFPWNRRRSRWNPRLTVG